jgi:adenine C2-methylase RlmN of 23S rRNA A2503 and tRNA A37
MCGTVYVGKVRGRNICVTLLVGILVECHFCCSASGATVGRGESGG